MPTSANLAGRRIVRVRCEIELGFPWTLRRPARRDALWITTINTADRQSMLAPAVNTLAARVEAPWSLVAHGDGGTHALRKFPCQVGRQPGLDLRIPHPTVSLVHAEIRREGEFLNV